MFTYVYSLLIEKDICDHRNIFQLSFHVFMCVFHQEISSFFSVIRVSSFFSYFCVICNLVLSFPCGRNLVVFHFGRVRIEYILDSQKKTIDIRNKEKQDKNICVLHNQNFLSGDIMNCLIPIIKGNCVELVNLLFQEN